MNRSETFEQFLATQAANIDVWSFLLNLLLTAVLAVLLAEVYVRYGRSLSNRRRFSKTFVMIAMTTMVIITIVKSSLALSLGLVGALSIVRFRAAIKEPEELAFLFLNIAIGLGFGANQRAVTICGFLAIVSTIFLTGMSKRKSEDTLHLAVSSDGAREVSAAKLIDILKAHTLAIELKRYNVSGAAFEGVFEISLRDHEAMDALTHDLKSLGEQISIVFVDNKHIAL